MDRPTWLLLEQVLSHCRELTFYSCFSLAGRSSPTGRAEECPEYRNATDAGTAVLKGSTYLLLKNSENLADEERPRLRALLELNQALSTTYLVKEDLKRL